MLSHIWVNPEVISIEEMNLGHKGKGKTHDILKGHTEVIWSITYVNPRDKSLLEVPTLGSGTTKRYEIYRGKSTPRVCQNIRPISIKQIASTSNAQNQFTNKINLNNEYHSKDLQNLTTVQETLTQPECRTLHKSPSVMTSGNSGLNLQNYISSLYQE